MLRVKSRAWGMAVCVSTSVLLHDSPANADIGHNLEAFKIHVARFVQAMDIKLPISVAEDQLPKGFVAQTECKGVADDVRCTINARREDLANAPSEFIEYMAAHETCHIKLKHYALSVVDHITRTEELERDADRCARERIGWEKFIPSMVRRLIDSNKAYGKIPIAALTDAIRKVYGREE